MLTHHGMNADLRSLYASPVLQEYLDPDSKAYNAGVRPKEVGFLTIY